MSSIICLNQLINTMQTNIFQQSSPSTTYSLIESDYVISVNALRQIRKAFVDDMEIGLNEDDKLPQNKKKSSLKMLSSHIRNVPTGTEQGVFYTLDWGGTNYRVVRVEFSGEKGKTPKTNEFKMAIPKKYQSCSSSVELFDHLAGHVKNKLIADKELNSSLLDSPKYEYKVGFTFSFPMAKPAVDQGILCKWTKGFDVPEVEGKDVAQLMNNSFSNLDINAQIHAVCNDTVGTLLATAYKHDNVRVGVILGTGSNASYIEPNSPNIFTDESKTESKQEIINIEWGNFDKVPRNKIDLIMDKYCPNTGDQFAEKIISGFYLGEMVRLLAIEIFGKDRIKSDKWEFKSEIVSAILKCYYDENIETILEILNGMDIILNDKNDGEIFGKICVLIVGRSADLAATLLLGTLEKTGLYKCKNDGFQLNEEYKCDNEKMLTVGIDGSVFKYVPKYQKRMEKCMNEVVGNEIGKRIKLVLASDGSGRGAALAVASGASMNVKVQ
eukprot:195713_1